ncbi:hypothetical protein J27TS8_10880 [Robertmurraya siralis]|uniref:Uncharacterized protein n=1 Tax=Robertmurraya siralis TaxID=77777 RepID=A0A919WFM8_9BACI|nr:hypothetical protein J27TS8_10880 [Robertmurraya siralis]
MKLVKILDVFELIDNIELFIHLSEVYSGYIFYNEDLQLRKQSNRTKYKE